MYHPLIELGYLRLVLGPMRFGFRKRVLNDPEQCFQMWGGGSIKANLVPLGVLILIF